MIYVKTTKYSYATSEIEIMNKFFYFFFFFFFTSFSESTDCEVVEAASLSAGKSAFRSLGGEAITSFCKFLKANNNTKELHNSVEIIFLKHINPVKFKNYPYKPFLIKMRPDE